MHLACFSNKMGIRIPDWFKVVPHRLQITLCVRLSSSRPLLRGACAGALLLLLVQGAVWQGQEGRWCRRAALIHLGAFAAHFGTQTWMTLFSGVVLFFGLPRQSFGAVQRLLFPVYFALNAALGCAALATLPPDANSTQVVCGRLVCLVCDSLGALVIVPSMVRALDQRGRLEQEGKGGAPYLAMHRHFRRLHGACATVNLVAMGCNAAHLYWLAGKLVSDYSLPS